MSPSTLSRQVAALERTLGCVLLRRSTQHVALTLVQAAAAHEELPDAERLTEHARSCKVDVRLEIYPVDAESFQLYSSFLPEAAAAIAQAGAYVRAAGSCEVRPKYREPK